VLLAELILSQSAGFEFKHQLPDFFTASSLEVQPLAQLLYGGSHGPILHARSQSCPEN
jgi:hypothetical protein